MSLRQIKFRDADDLFIVIVRDDVVLNCQWHTQNNLYGKYQDLEQLPPKAKAHIKLQLEKLNIKIT